MILHRFVEHVKRRNGFALDHIEPGSRHQACGPRRSSLHSVCDA